GPMRYLMLTHYLTNYAGDDAWIYRIRYELRNFNYVGDTTWLTGEVVSARLDEVLGPVVEVNVRGTNQRGQQNIVAQATLLVPSQKPGPVRMPKSPPVTSNRSSAAVTGTLPL